MPPEPQGSARIAAYQRRAPCNRGEATILGGCWLANPEEKPPCGDGYFEWDKRCYAPLFPTSRQPTSEP
jgi:hypothetical protein